MQNDLSEEDVHLLARILSVGLVDADPNYLHHLKMYRDLHGRWATLGQKKMLLFQEWTDAAPLFQGRVDVFSNNMRSRLRIFSSEFGYYTVELFI